VPHGLGIYGHGPRLAGASAPFKHRNSDVLTEAGDGAGGT
jgi:hypothetical protein